MTKRIREWLSRRPWWWWMLLAFVILGLLAQLTPDSWTEAASNCTCDDRWEYIWTQFPGREGC